MSTDEHDEDTEHAESGLGNRLAPWVVVFAAVMVVSFLLGMLSCGVAMHFWDILDNTPK